MMNSWISFVRKLCIASSCLAGVVLAFMLTLTVTDVILRAFRRPILGTYEIISYCGAVVIGFSLPYTSFLKGHVAVDILLAKLSQKASRRMQVVTRLVSILLFFWLGWNFVAIGTSLMTTNEVSGIYRLPFYPIAYGLGAVCLIQCFALVVGIMQIVRREA
jgi:TRAP-type C4-dicarboxylate transport system permease small subunit